MSDNPERVFTLFPILPPEIRISIWKAALPDPRFVEIRHDDLNLGPWYPFYVDNVSLNINNLETYSEEKANSS